MSRRGSGVCTSIGTLPLAESDPDVASLADKWRRSHSVHAALVAWASRERLSLETARRRVIWHAIEIVRSHEINRPQYVRLHRRWLTDRFGRKRLVIPSQQLAGEQWVRWWHKEAWRWASLLMCESESDDEAASARSSIDPDMLADTTAISGDEPISLDDWDGVDIQELVLAATDDERKVFEAFEKLERQMHSSDPRASRERWKAARGLRPT
ncbi:MAG: hypothetical protein JWM41_2168 [Gemmatimonadetes bacterium]|nr:hypothetical protein [Gemmatimonadota bacterium]